MRTSWVNWGTWMVFAGACIAAVLGARLALAAPSGVSIAVTGANQVTVTVTNSVTNGHYEIYWQQFLDGSPLTNGTWQLLVSGTPGVTNFSFDVGDTYTGFFRAVNHLDFDMDGVLNSQDARPFDPSVGILTVTIETPLNGANVQ